MPLACYPGHIMRGRLVRLDRPAAERREALEAKMRRDLAEGPRTLAELLVGMSPANRGTILAHLHKWAAAGEIGETVTYEKRTGPGGYHFRRDFAQGQFNRATSGAIADRHWCAVVKSEMTRRRHHGVQVRRIFMQGRIFGVARHGADINTGAAGAQAPIA